MLYPGRRVRCIDGSNWPKFSLVPEMLPVEGEGYTILAVFDGAARGWDEDGLILREVINPPREGTGGWDWLAFRASRFAPLYPTNIDVFLAMLEPQPVRFDLVGFSSVRPEMLTPSEVQSLRREAKETSAYFRKAFAHLRPKAKERRDAR